MIEKVLTKWKKYATIIPETERKPQKCGLDKKKNQPEKKQSLEESVMNRTFENRGKTNFDTYRNEAYGQDYLVLALLAVIRFFALPRVKTACTALSILAAFCVMLGIVGGVETGMLPLYCLFPLLGLCVLGVVGTHMARK